MADNASGNDNAGNKGSGGDQQGAGANKSGAQGSGGEAKSAADFIPPQFRDFAQKAAELANNPMARTVMAAGLVTAAAALTANKKVRDNARKAGRDAIDSAEEAAETASRMGVAMATAAADTFRKMMNLDEQGAGASGSEGKKPEGAASASGGETASDGKSNEKPASKPRAAKGTASGPEAPSSETSKPASRKNTGGTAGADKSGE